MATAGISHPISPHPLTGGTADTAGPKRCSRSALMASTSSPARRRRVIDSRSSIAAWLGHSARSRPGQNGLINSWKSACAGPMSSALAWKLDDPTSNAATNVNVAP
jgi:hypothetical protein